MVFTNCCKWFFCDRSKFMQCDITTLLRLIEHRNVMKTTVDVLEFHFTTDQACYYLSMLGLKLNHVSKRGSGDKGCILAWKHSTEEWKNSKVWSVGKQRTPLLPLTYICIKVRGELSKHLGQSSEEVLSKRGTRSHFVNGSIFVTICLRQLQNIRLKSSGCVVCIWQPNATITKQAMNDIWFRA